jgi:hypothetical protein
MTMATEKPPITRIGPPGGPSRRVEVPPAFTPSQNVPDGPTPYGKPAPRWPDGFPGIPPGSLPGDDPRGGGAA